VTKKGYTHVIVPKDLHAHLKMLSEAQGLSMASLIQNLLSINTRINTTLHNGGSGFPQTDLKTTSFLEKVAGPRGFEPRNSGSAGQRLNPS
jgi:hypothetical protein